MTLLATLVKAFSTKFSFNHCVVMDVCLLQGTEWRIVGDLFVHCCFEQLWVDVTSIPKERFIVNNTYRCACVLLLWLTNHKLYISCYVQNFLDFVLCQYTALTRLKKTKPHIYAKNCQCEIFNQQKQIYIHKIEYLKTRLFNYISKRNTQAIFPRLTYQPYCQAHQLRQQMSW